MKLLIAADIFPPQAGGPATYVVSLANALVKEGIGVSIVSLNRESDRSVVSPAFFGTGCMLYIVSFKNKLARYIQYFYLLYKHAKHADVIYAMGPVNAGLPAWFAARLRRKKFAVKVVGDYAWEQYQNHRTWITEHGSQDTNVQDSFLSVEEFQKHKKISLKIRVLRFVERFVARHADAVIVPSVYLKKMVLGWGVQEERVRVIYNAVSLPDHIVPEQKPVEEQWIVSIGRLVPWKGFDILVRLMPRLLENFPTLRLKLIGDGPEQYHVSSLISHFKLENTVELLGALSKEQTFSYIAAANLFILNSGYEGLSHVLLEAMQIGRPVIASANGGNMELLPQEHLFRYNDEEEIFAKVSHFLSHSQASTYHLDAHRFSFDRMIADTKTSLTQICASS